MIVNIDFRHAELWQTLTQPIDIVEKIGSTWNFDR
jgi:hypothetical protein